MFGRGQKHGVREGVSEGKADIWHMLLSPTGEMVSLKRRCLLQSRIGKTESK